MSTLARKPLGGPAYWSTPHLIGSRMGPGDDPLHQLRSDICTWAPRDADDRVIVTEKLDGSCVAVAMIRGQPTALGRAGYLANSSPHEQHHLFARWVEDEEMRFPIALKEGERVVGEWLAQAHGTRYHLTGEPFVPFAVIGADGKRLPHDEARRRFLHMGLPGARVLSDGPPRSIEVATLLLGEFGHHGALDPVEGAVWVVERAGAFDFIAKWVRPDKKDGHYLPDVSGEPAVWNWRP